MTLMLLAPATSNPRGFRACTLMILAEAGKKIADCYYCGLLKLMDARENTCARCSALPVSEDQMNAAIAALADISNVICRLRIIVPAATKQFFDLRLTNVAKWGRRKLKRREVMWWLTQGFSIHEAARRAGVQRCVARSALLQLREAGYEIRCGCGAEITSQHGWCSARRQERLWTAA